MVIYDVANRDSFQSCAKWLAAVRAVHGGKPVPGVLIANKSDPGVEGRAQVTSEAGAKFAKENSLTYFECSPLNNKEVDAPFEFIANAFHKKYVDAMGVSTTSLDLRMHCVYFIQNISKRYQSEYSFFMYVNDTYHTQSLFEIHNVQSITNLFFITAKTLE